MPCGCCCCWCNGDSGNELLPPPVAVLGRDFAPGTWPLLAAAEEVDVEEEPLAADAVRHGLLVEEVEADDDEVAATGAFE